MGCCSAGTDREYLWPGIGMHQSGSLVDTAHARLLKLANVLLDLSGGSSTDELLNRLIHAARPRRA
jgi:hypothetical protein